MITDVSLFGLQKGSCISVRLNPQDWRLRPPFYSSVPPISDDRHSCGVSVILSHVRASTDLMICPKGRGYHETTVSVAFESRHARVA